jgi:DNA helicase-2/ATP-dependent DNA helicase PcrA
VDYNFGYPVAKGDRESISLGHDDVLHLTVALMKLPKFRRLLTARYPILLIDEYQDTNAAFANSLTSHFLETDEKMLVGFFGDHWQKIYDDTCGKIEHRALRRIKKGANFRSAPAIVDVLNRMRPELPQAVSKPTAQGSVAVYHTNGWRGGRRSGNNWAGDLWPEVATKYVDAMIERLRIEGWPSDPTRTKYLLLTHRILAARQGYPSFVDIFQYNEAFLRKEDPHVAFLIDTVEPVAVAYEHQRFGEMFAALGTETPHISSHGAKVDWTTDLDQLLELRKRGTIGDVIDHLRRTERPRVPEAVEQREVALEQQGRQDVNQQADSVDLLQRLRNVEYHELMALARFINEETPFATKHGVKGAEFENVLVVFGRGWFKYDFVQFLEWAGDPQNIPPDELETFERNRNLFYVVCSRAKTQLAIMFTQEVTEEAMQTLTNWFGPDAVQALDSPV